MNLVIVESPTKAKTISKFLGKEFRVESSFGHLRDLPKSKMGIDIEHNFEPNYIVPPRSKKRVTELKSLSKKSDHIYFATDEDREGEAISWHLALLLDMDPSQVSRIVFHEITKEAILEALKSPRSINQHLVDAQQARRVLDRLVGYELSPFLWKKVARGLSAGRVQSVAVRVIVEREREIQAFKQEEYWTIEGRFKTLNQELFDAQLQQIDGRALKKLEIQNEERAKKILTDLDGANFSVAAVERKKTKRNPQAPFTTSTLQQDANRKLGFSARQTMMIAQQLYEGVELSGEGSIGLITYMRTDSVNLAQKFLNEAGAVLANKYGKEYAVTGGRRYQAKSKNAQEAHEAIRPTDAHRDPDRLRNDLDSKQFKLYDLIWRRALASQMPEAELDSSKGDVIDNTQRYTFRATGQTVRFDGFLKLYPESLKETTLPALAKDDAVTAETIKPEQHTTQPPSRYSEAGLVKVLEENGIGRPSTYAPTISTVIERGYIEKEQRRLKPLDMAFVVNDLLVQHFPEIVDIQFTAKLENGLDRVAGGEQAWVPLIADFYHPFKQHLTEKEKIVSKKEVTEQASKEVCEKCGKPMVVKIGRFGKFLACTGYPECRNTKQINKNGEVEAPEVTKEVCEKCGKPMAMKRGRYGPFLGCSGYPECKNIKKIEKSTGVKCPQCEKGEIVEKRSRFGKMFFSCNQYPDCKFALWSKPTGEKCPQCGSLLLYGAKGAIRCSSKECKYKTEATENGASSVLN